MRENIVLVSLTIVLTAACVLGCASITDFFGKYPHTATAILEELDAALDCFEDQLELDRSNPASVLIFHAVQIARYLLMEHLLALMASEYPEVDTSEQLARFMALSNPDP